MRSRLPFPSRFLPGWFLGGLLAPAAFALGAEAPRGVVIQSFGSGSPLEARGAAIGDRFVGWQRSASAGALRSVYDWWKVETERVLPGNLMLHGLRGGVEISLPAPAEAWKVQVRPALTAEVLEAYEVAARAAARRGTTGEGASGGADRAPWIEALRLASTREPPAARCWLLQEFAAAQARAGALEEAAATLRNALELADSYRIAVELHEALGLLHYRRGDLPAAAGAFQAMLDALPEALAVSQLAARGWQRLGWIETVRDELGAAGEAFRRALEIHRSLAPGTMAEASSLNNLGLLARRAGDPEAAAEHHEAALAIVGALAPGSPSLANGMHNLGILYSHVGDFPRSFQLLREGLELRRRLDPGSDAVARSLVELGLLHLETGDLERAYDALVEGLLVLEEVAPESLDVVKTQGNLVALHLKARDYAGAVFHGTRAMEDLERIVPGSRDVAVAWLNLGNAWTALEELDKARSAYRRALEILEPSHPHSRDTSDVYTALGVLASKRGEPQAAKGHLRRSLELLQRQAPGSLRVANCLYLLGALELESGSFNMALRWLEQAHRIQTRLAPESIAEALTLDRTARGLLGRKQLRSALATSRQAVRALESQARRLGLTPQHRAEFRAFHKEIYRTAIEISLESGLAEEAFELLERSRAHGFLELLAERDLGLDEDVPEELARDRLRNAVLFDRALARREALGPEAAPEAFARIEEELTRLRQQRRILEVTLRREAGPRAALEAPETLSLGAALESLDPGVVALIYEVGVEATELFVLARGQELVTRRIGRGREQLERQVEAWLEDIRSAEPGAGTGAWKGARDLYDALIRPAEQSLAGAERILLIPDGPLHRLPFAALVRSTEEPGPPGRGWGYLVEWKPLSFALSMTVHAQGRSARGGRIAEGARSFVGFADPSLPAPGVATAQVAESSQVFPQDLAVRRFSGRWTPLPYARQEVEAIARLYPRAGLYLGSEATETVAKALGKDIDILHFATHVALDDHFPMSSALVLASETGGGRGDNGLLQVWEIFRDVRLDAELVVLSACQSALGQELQGEGLIGLTRAFQFAGARSVAASLWSVADQVTARLMVTFHEEVMRGSDLDAALRAAQVEFLGSPLAIEAGAGGQVELDASAPWFWAAFQLYGDARPVARGASPADRSSGAIPGGSGATER